MLARAKDEFSPCSATSCAIPGGDHQCPRRARRLVACRRAPVTGIIDRRRALSAWWTPSRRGPLDLGKIELRLQLLDLRELAVRSIEHSQPPSRGGTRSRVGRARPRTAGPGAAQQVIGTCRQCPQVHAGRSARCGSSPSGRRHAVCACGIPRRASAAPVGALLDLFVQEPQALDRSRGGSRPRVALVKRSVAASEAPSRRRARGGDAAASSPCTCPPGLTGDEPAPAPP